LWRLQARGYLDAHPADGMSSRIPAGGQAAAALLGVLACTAMFYSATRRMGWHPLAASALLFAAGHLASKV